MLQTGVFSKCSNHSNHARSLWLALLGPFTVMTPVPWAGSGTQEVWQVVEILILEKSMLDGLLNPCHHKHCIPFIPSSSWKGQHQPVMSPPTNVKLLGPGLLTLGIVTF